MPDLYEDENNVRSAADALLTLFCSVPDTIGTQVFVNYHIFAWLLNACATSQLQNSE
jgi:hypothetical protein